MNILRPETLDFLIRMELIFKWKVHIYIIKKLLFSKLFNAKNVSKVFASKYLSLLKNLILMEAAY